MKTLRQVFAPVLGLKVTDLDKKSSASTISSWDSVTNLILIAEIEKEYHVVISIEDVYTLKNIGDVYLLIKNKGIKLTF